MANRDNSKVIYSFPDKTIALMMIWNTVTCRARPSSIRNGNDDRVVSVISLLRYLHSFSSLLTLSFLNSRFVRKQLSRLPEITVRPKLTALPSLPPLFYPATPRLKRWRATSIWRSLPILALVPNLLLAIYLAELFCALTPLLAKDTWVLAYAKLAIISPSTSARNRTYRP